MAALLLVAAGRAGTTPPLQLRVLQGQALNLNRTATLDVEVSNHGATAVRELNFSVLWQSYPFGWSQDGPSVLAPGESATYHLSAPSPEAAPPGEPEDDGSLKPVPFALRAGVGGSTYQVAHVSPPSERAVALVNPGFDYWQWGPEKDVPYGWRKVLKQGRSGAASVGPAAAGGVSLQATSRTQDWAEAGLVQTSALPRCDILRLTSQRTADYVTDGKWPVTIAGVELGTGLAGRPFAWFPLTSQPIPSYTLPPAQLIAPVAAPPLSTVDIPVTERLEAAGWTVPAREVFKVFVAVYGQSQPARIDVRRMECVSPGGTSQ